MSDPGGHEVSDFEAAGLYDPAAAGADDRLALLTWLDSFGFAIEDFVEADGRDALIALASDRRVLQGSPLPDAEAAAVSGLTIDELRTYATAFGFTPMFAAEAGGMGLNRPEAEMLAVFGALRSMFTEVEALGFVRVVGSALSRVAEAAMTLFLNDVETPHVAADGGELALAKKSFDAVGLLDEFVPLLDTVLRRHLAQATSRSRAALILDDRRFSRFAVGFIDLVGFTPVSQGLGPEELRTFIRDFEGLAHSAVTELGARLVKLIGDEVMFVTPDANAACAVAQALMVTFRAGRAEVQPRGGLAFGPVLLQGGDYYGEVVNLASRLADAAVPMELLVTVGLDEAASDVEFEPAGRRQLKGFTDPVSVRSLLFDEP